MTKEISTHAKTAKEIRKELKTAFPNIKFSVTSESFSMGNSVNIQYEDGPQRRDIESITNKYQYGHFDGMTDMYEYSNKQEDVTQVKFVTVSRKMNPETGIKIAKEIDKKYHTEGNVFNSDGTINIHCRFGVQWIRELIWRLFSERSFA